MLRAALAETGDRGGDAVMVGDTDLRHRDGARGGLPHLGVAWGYHPPRLRAAGADMRDRGFRRLGPRRWTLSGRRHERLGGKTVLDRGAVVPVEGGFAVRLDGRPVRTPAKGAAGPADAGRWPRRSPPNGPRRRARSGPTRCR
jgi:hypothetical protein